MSQIKIVKGNDAPIQWRVSYQGQPLDLTGKAVTLYVINSRGPFQLKSFEVEGNVVTATYYGADQTRFGEHSLVLRLNEGAPEMSTVAVKEAFELVEWSKDQGGESGEPIKVTPIILEADFAIAPKVDVDPSNYYTKDEANAAFQPKGNYLPREEFEERIEGYATHDRVQKLSENVTELSTQVGGLSERVDALGEGAEQEVFWATEGITDASKGTTYDEILAAHNAGKVVKCLYQKIIFDLRYVTNILYFAANVNNNLYYLKCPQSNRWQFSTENTEHKLETLDNGNAQITIAGKSAEVATPQYVENAIQQSGGGGGTIGKEGVLKQTQQWGVTNNVASYTMLDIVRGIISQDDIDLYESLGAVFNEESGYFELNSLTDISLEEMRLIHTYGNIPPIIDITGYATGGKIRTCLPIYINASAAQKMQSFFQYDNRIESIVMNADNSPRDIEGLCDTARYFHTLIIPNYTQGKKFWARIQQLKTCLIKGIKANIELPSSALLSNESILYMIQNETATTAISITLHADAYDRAMADTEIQAALTAHPNVSLAK